MLRDAFTASERVHLIGLVSDGGVHSGWTHIEALIRLGAELGVPDLVLHAFTDGRDTFPHVRRRLPGDGRRAGWTDAGAGRIGSVVGRYYAMDRDKRWDRIQLAYDLLVHGRAEHHADDRRARRPRRAYERDETDEFIKPGAGRGGGADPPRRLGRSGSTSGPTGCARSRRALADPRSPRSTAAARHRRALRLHDRVRGGLAVPGRVPARAPVGDDVDRARAHAASRQLHVAETEKYPHVTYFFNGGEEQPCEGERRELVPSPRDVPTYDYKPEMSAREAAAAFVDAWKDDSPTFGIINFANPDMVGHTGVIPAAVQGDRDRRRAASAQVVAAVHESGGACFITADHGNSDHMLEDDGSPNTAHSLNPVPVIVTGPGADAARRRRPRRRHADAARGARDRAAGDDDAASR